MTNDNTPRTHGCIALGPSGNRQGSLKCFDLETGKVVTRRVIKQIPWPDGTIEIANAWGRKSKHFMESITFLNRHHDKFDWENDNMSDLVVTKDQPKLIHPTIAAELPGIDVESDRTTPSRVQILNNTDVTDCASAARVIAGLDVEVETNTETRGVDIASVSVLNDDADAGR